ncbi:MAG: outer membrane PBP1 activator LpoA protein [Granulosicoccus sp.]|jgi:outer membrane PBP1 activator LpoA protein
MNFLKGQKSDLGQYDKRRSRSANDRPMHELSMRRQRIGTSWDERLLTFGYASTRYTLTVAKLLTFSLGIAVLSACVSPKASLPPLNDNPMNARVTDPAARRQLQLGNPIGAADVYLQRANRTSSPAQKEDYLLLAAEILFDRSMIPEGRLQMSNLPSDLAQISLQNRRDILIAKDYIFERNAIQALEALPDPLTIENEFHRARLYETQAQAYGILQDPDNELIARIELEQQINDPAIQRRGHEQIWRLLTTQPLSSLRRMTTNVRGDTYQGWIELALRHAAAGIEGDKRRKGINDWQQRYPNHPANPEFVTSLYLPSNFDSDAANDKPIKQIAVLLPLSGSNTASVAAAIRDGIIAAHDHAKSEQKVPVLRFYDVGENSGYARTAFATAVNDGANAVIGPLRKDAVAAIASQRDVTVPTITLNTIQSSGLTPSASNVIQFGLAPEDEARSAAARAAGLSLLNAVVFQADDSRGEREAGAFQDAMYLYGGDIAHTAILPKDKYDYSEQIKEALGIDKSDDRFRTLSATIGEKLFFEPAVRNDIDVIFLALTNEQARSVRPQLDFFHARAITRLGTSRVAAIDDDAKKNKDLNTIFYPDAPWVLRKSMKKDPVRTRIIETFPAAEGAYAKLYALGADSYQLVTNLNALSQGQRLQGYTGGLELAPDGRIRRHLDWAQYVNGVSEPVKSVEAPALPSISTSLMN